MLWYVDPGSDCRLHISSSSRFLYYLTYLKLIYCQKKGLNNDGLVIKRSSITVVQSHCGFFQLEVKHWQ